MRGTCLGQIRVERGESLLIIAISDEAEVTWASLKLADIL